jgi:cell division protein ZapA
VVSTEHVTVRIFGENYPLRTAEPAARLEELARFVDARMREIAATGKVIVTSKIAVLAALHFADELFRLREAGAARSSEEDALRIAALVETLDRVLDEQ